MSVVEKVNQKSTKSGKKKVVEEVGASSRSLGLYLFDQSQPVASPISSVENLESNETGFDSLKSEEALVPSLPQVDEILASLPSVPEEEVGQDQVVNEVDGEGNHDCVHVNNNEDVPADDPTRSIILDTDTCNVVGLTLDGEVNEDNQNVLGPGLADPSETCPPSKQQDPGNGPEEAVSLFQPAEDIGKFISSSSNIVVTIYQPVPNAQFANQVSSSEFVEHQDEDEDNISQDQLSCETHQQQIGLQRLYEQVVIVEPPKVINDRKEYIPLKTTWEELMDLIDGDCNDLSYCTYGYGYGTCSYSQLPRQRNPTPMSFLETDNLMKPGLIMDEPVPETTELPITQSSESTARITDSDIELNLTLLHQYDKIDDNDDYNVRNILEFYSMQEEKRLKDAYNKYEWTRPREIHRARSPRQQKPKEIKTSTALENVWAEIKFWTVRKVRRSWSTLKTVKSQVFKAFSRKRSSSIPVSTDRHHMSFVPSSNSSSSNRLEHNVTENGRAGTRRLKLKKQASAKTIHGVQSNLRGTSSKIKIKTKNETRKQHVRFSDEGILSSNHAEKVDHSRQAGASGSVSKLSQICNTIENADLIKNCATSKSNCPNESVTGNPAKLSQHKRTSQPPNPRIQCSRKPSRESPKGSRESVKGSRSSWLF